MGNTIGQANAVSNKPLDLRFCKYAGDNLSGKTLSGEAPRRSLLAAVAPSQLFRCWLGLGVAHCCNVPLQPSIVRAGLHPLSSLCLPALGPPALDQPPPPPHPPKQSFKHSIHPRTHAGALMVETDLRGANLQEAVLTKAYAVRADLSGGCWAAPLPPAVAGEQTGCRAQGRAATAWACSEPRALSAAALGCGGAGQHRLLCSM